jgi:hypothetical protein
MGLGYKDTELICITKHQVLKFCERNFLRKTGKKYSLAFVRQGYYTWCAREHSLNLRLKMVCGV